MSQYNGNAAAVRDLVRETEVHRDVYVDQEIFDLEMEHLFANTWVYVGHDSQVPNAGRLLRHHHRQAAGADGAPHRRRRSTSSTTAARTRARASPSTPAATPANSSAARITPGRSRPTARCSRSRCARATSTPAWRRATPIKGMTPVRHVKNYRGFVFAKMNDVGPDFEEYFGESLSTIDNMVDRSPAGRLEVAGGVLRYMHNCNWKMLVENLTDTCHPMVAHESSAGTAVEVWKKMFPGSNKKPPAVEIYAPFMSPYEFFEKMGIRVWRNGHGHTGVHHSIHSDYSAIPGYFEKMVAAYGEERAKAILDENRHNTSYFPNFTVKGPIQAIRAVQADRAEPHAGRILDLPSGRRARPAARAHADLQPADQRADLDRRSRRPRNVRARAGRAACRRQPLGQHSAALRPGGSRSRRPPSSTAPRNGRCATSSAPGRNS